MPVLDDTLIRQNGTVTVRPVAVSDAEALFPAMADANLTCFLAWEPHRTVEETRQVLGVLADAHRQAKGWHWAILENALAVGLISLIDIRRTHRTWRLDRAELAYWVSPSAQGRGLATCASRMVAELAFGPLSLEKLMIANATDNPSSGRVAEHLGARLIGTEHRAFEKNGKWHDLTWRELHKPRNENLSDAQH